jgi:hypothetical protein
LSAINGSNVTTGTVANARTTAASANGASTIVARDANGSFAANVGTFVSVSGAHSGNGAGLSDINASNISTGTISNARTTGASANGASTLVLRDANGSFAGNVITGTTGTFTNISGNGSSLTAINASAITTGTLDNARTTAASANGASTIVARDANGSFTANVVNVTTLSGGAVSGNGSALTAINASNLSAGTVASAHISGSYTGITGVGTLTAGTWNATAIGAQYGGTGSANLTAENVILGNGASSVKVVAPGTANNVLTSNGTTWISQAPSAAGGFAAGTVMLFAQTSAPTGWTKNTTTGDNSALRVVTGTASTGGSVAFTTAFTSQTPTITVSAISGSAGATTLTTPQIPSHTHPHNYAPRGFSGGGAGDNWVRNGGGPYVTGGTGGDGSHTHPFSFSSGTATSSAINLAVQYIDVIRASKD